MRVIGIDPGDKYNGWATVELMPDKKMYIHRVPEILNRRQLLDHLHECLLSGIDLVICEDWLTRPNVARPGGFDFNSMQTARIIGAVEVLTENAGVDFLLQPPSIKPAGYGFLGKKYVKGARNMHHWDALCHCAYYLVTKKNALPMMPN